MIQAGHRGGVTERPRGTHHGRARVLVAVEARNSVLGVATVTVAAWGLLVGLSLSVPVLGAAVGTLIGAVLGAMADRQHSAPQSVDPGPIFEGISRYEPDEVDAPWRCSQDEDRATGPDSRPR